MTVEKAKGAVRKVKRPRPAAELGEPKSRTPPTSGKPLETYEKLIAAAGELLGEIGFEKLTTNAICARVGMTPPALYRYFADKYEIIEVLARRFLKRQNDAYALWLMKGDSWAILERPEAFLKAWYRIAAEIVATEPGAVWIMRALRAMPNLAHVRLESQREQTDRLFEFYRRIVPEMDPDVLWTRLRIRVEMGWVVDEMAMEEDQIPHDILFREVAKLMGSTPLARAER